jgi:hypothetical protein
MYWDDGVGGPKGNPYHQPYGSPSHSYQPPPPAYAQYPPPVYANPYVYPMVYRRPPNPALPKVGGLFSILAGAFGLLEILTLFGGEIAFWLEDWWLVCYIFTLALSIMAILGGIVAMKRRMFPVAVIGAVCAIISGGLWGMSLVMGLVALVLMVVGKDAFTSSTPPHQYPWY